jgi:uncharacterized protein (DUF885 family)
MSITRKLLYFIVFAATFLIACNKNNTAPDVPKDNTAFIAYEGHFLDAFWKLNPDWATSVGYHKYDSLLVIPGTKSRDALFDFVKLQNDSLSRYEISDLSETNQMDYQILQSQLEQINWKLEVLKSYEWDPSSYNPIGAFSHVLNTHYAPLAKRLRNFYEKMAGIPAYYKEVQKQLKNPVVELTDLAIEQHLGGISVFEKDFSDSLSRSNIPQAEQKQMLERVHASVETIKTYVSWLKAMKNDHPRSFRLGKQYYDDKFKYEIQSTSNAQQTYNAAFERKKYLHREMTKISKQLWPKYFGKDAMPADSLDMIARVIKAIAAKHVTADEFQSAIEKQLPALVSFVKEKDLVTLDPSKPLIVRREPGYMAGISPASMTAPGPYDKGGSYYFNVESLAGWPPDKSESFLQEYNQYTLQLLCMHEAVPGHYVQMVDANKSGGLIRAIFGNSAMMEGWAVYSEQMMLDNGYNDDPEMKLMWYKWQLRSVYNTILDYGVHTANMPKEQVMTALTHDAFQEQAEADSKWKQLTVTSVQLDSYYIGYKEIIDLRETYKKKQGDKFRLKDFNDKFLSYGSVPVKFIKAAMMGIK